MTNEVIDCMISLRSIRSYMDKAVSKQILDACGIPTPRWQLLSYGVEEAASLADTLPMPCVIARRSIG